MERVGSGRDGEVDGEETTGLFTLQHRL
jgi:hypothetical protein